MFNLEQFILEWRRQMQAVGLKNPHVLDELESHLWEESERQINLGLSPQDAFETAVRRIGQAKALNYEFKKITGIKEVREWMKHSVFTLAGIPNHYLKTSMNTPGANSNIEPGWATYLKAAMFVAPAVCLWGLALLKIVPSLKAVSDGAGFSWPEFSRINIGFAELLKDKCLYLVSGVILALILLEWRSANWPRYRRAAIALTTFILNSSLLISLFLIIVTAALLAVRIAHPVK